MSVVVVVSGRLVGLRGAGVEPAGNAVNLAGDVLHRLDHECQRPAVRLVINAVDRELRGAETVEQVQGGSHRRMV